MEHVECALAVAHRKLEGLSGLGIGDRHRRAVLARVPQQPDVDPVGGAAVELACDLGACLGHLVVLPGRVIAAY
jgi:hypothetical protein